MSKNINISERRDSDLIAKLNAICQRKKPILLNTLAKQLLHESADRLCDELGIQLSNTQSAKAG